VRFWDVANEENYVLSLASAGHGVTKSDQALALAFNPIQRYLAVGRCRSWIQSLRFTKDKLPITQLETYIFRQTA
jgi:hypothetical protein